jgi:hypothetical protein
VSETFQRSFGPEELLIFDVIIVEPSWSGVRKKRKIRKRRQLSTTTNAQINLQNTQTS